MRAASCRTAQGDEGTVVVLDTLRAFMDHCFPAPPPTPGAAIPVDDLARYTAGFAVMG